MSSSPDHPALCCNVCGSRELTPRGKRGNMLCGGCGSDGRTRLLWLVLIRHGLLKPGMRLLHIAPERALAARIHAITGDGYEGVDIEPERFDFAPNMRRLDLLEDAASLPTGHYDLVMHSHVMEHVRGNVSAILFHLHRALKPEGHQVCCIPIARERHYAEVLGPIPPEEALARFGQEDHVRVFGARDIQSTLGKIFTLPGRYNLLDRYDAETLRRHAIAEVVWHDWSPNSVLVLRKEDLLLKA